jgi:hypothetical protein
LLTDIATWAKRFPIISERRHLRACMAAAVSFPNGDDELTLGAARLYLGLGAMHDVVDGVIPAGARDDPTAPWAQAATLHAELIQWLEGRRGAQAYGPAFFDRLNVMIRSWEIEESWKHAIRNGAAAPSFEAYVANGRESVIHAAILLALLVMAPPDPVVPWEDAAPSVEQVLVGAATTIRLANDFRSFAMDQAKGKPTAIALLMQERHLTEAAADRELLAMIDKYRRDLSTAVSALPAAMSPWGETAARLTTFGILV